MCPSLKHELKGYYSDGSSQQAKLSFSSSDHSLSQVRRGGAVAEWSKALL